MHLVLCFRAKVPSKLPVPVIHAVSHHVMQSFWQIRIFWHSASFRLNQGYRGDPQSNGIMMRRSSDNGRTWSTAQIIYQGTTWEPYALQLRSGEIQVYFTDSEPLTADSGTAAALYG